jgi:hypothetical protein
MSMQKSAPAPDPEAYVASLAGWQQLYVRALRAAVLAASSVAESIKWGHLVYHAGGPVLLIRAESSRVLFGFWRGQRLRHIEPRLKPGGKYEMATLELLEDSALGQPTVIQLVQEAVALNVSLGDPTSVVSARAKRAP